MRVAIVGANGQVGRELVSAFADHDVVAFGRAECDIAERASVDNALAVARPDVVVNAAADTDVNGAERSPERAYRVNALGTRWLALAAERVGAALVTYSTDYVFSGDGGAPYDEWAPTAPRSIYGRSKLAGEVEALRHCRRAAVVRTAWVYGGERSFVATIARLARERGSLEVVADEIGSPTLAADLAAATRRLVELDAPGVYHLTNAGECSRFELARSIVEVAGIDAELRPITGAAYGAKYPGQAPRPAHSTLANRAAAALGVELRPWRDALAEHLCARR